MGKYRMKRVDLTVSFHVRARVDSDTVRTNVNRLKYIAGRKVLAVHDRTHNGFQNYETATVAMILDNDRASHDHWKAVAAEAVRLGKDHHNTKPVGDSPAVWTHAEAARFMLADQLKDAMEAQAEASVKGGAEGLMGCLLRSAIEEVNWNQVADQFIED